MATLDFTELDKKPPGEALEALVRLIGERLGMRVEWSGRGADGGRDLIFHETQEGPLKSRSIKWLVNCKTIQKVVRLSAKGMLEASATKPLSTNATDSRSRRQRRHRPD